MIVHVSFFVRVSVFARGDEDDHRLLAASAPVAGELQPDLAGDPHRQVAALGHERARAEPGEQAPAGCAANL
jgi:hypothetical protein